MRQYFDIIGFVFIVGVIMVAGIIVRYILSLPLQYKTDLWGVLVGAVLILFTIVIGKRINK